MMKRTEDDTRDGSSYQFLDLTDAGQNEASALMGILYPSSDASSVAQEPPSSVCQQNSAHGHTPRLASGPSMSRPKEVEQQQQPAHAKDHFQVVLPQELSQLNGLNPHARAFDPVPIVFLPRPMAIAGVGTKVSRTPFGKDYPPESEHVTPGPGGGGMVIVPVRKHSLVSTPLLAQSTPPVSTASIAGNVGIAARSSALLSSAGVGGGLLRTASIVSASASAPPLPNFVNEGNSSSYVIDTEKVLGSGEQWIGFSVQTTATSVAAGGGGGGGGEVIARTSIVTAATMPPHTNNPHHLQQQQQQQHQQQQLGSGANNQQQQTGGQQQPGQGPPQTQPHNVGGRSGGGGGNGAGGGVTSGGDTGGRNADRENGNQQMQQQQAVSVSNPHQQQMLPHMYTPIPASAYIPPAPHGMYPVQMLPPTAAQVPNNVFVSNLTANVSVHGYPAISPYLATTATPPGAYMQADVGAGPEMQLIPQAPVTMSGRGTMRRGGRNNRGGNNSRSRGGYVPHYIQQQQQQQQQQSYHHQQQHAQSYHQSLAQQQQQGVMHHQGGQPQMQQHQVQQQQSQQGGQGGVGGGQQQQTPPTSVSGGGQQSQQQLQHPPQQHTPELMHIEGPPMMSAAGAQYGNLHGGFYLLPHMPQHASGTPLFMAAPQMQMYYNAPLHGYPNLVYPYIPSDYQLYDDPKGDDGGPPHGGQGHDDPGVHPGAAMWPQPPQHLTLDYHPETGEYLPVHEDDGSGAAAGMLPQGPPPQTMGHHVLDPNVPGFTMQLAPAPIVPMQQQPPEEYHQQQPQQQQLVGAGSQPQVEDYNGNGQIPVSSNASASAMHSPIVVTSVAQHNIVAGVPQPEDIMVSGGYLVGPGPHPPQSMTTMEGSTEVLMVPAEHQPHPGQAPTGGTGVMDGAQPINNNFLVDPQFYQSHPPPPSTLQQQQLQQQPQQQYQPVPTQPQGGAITLTDSPPSTTNQSFQATQHTVTTTGIVASSALDANGNDTNNNSSADNRKADIITSPKHVDAVVMTNHHTSPLPSNVSSTTTSSPQQNERTSPAMTTHQRGSDGSVASKQSNVSNVPNQQGFQQQQQQQQPPILGYAAAVASQVPPRTTRPEQLESAVKGTHERMEKLSLKDQDQRRTTVTASASSVVGGGVNPQRSSAAPSSTGRHSNAESGWVNNSGVGPKKGTASVSVSAIPNKEFPPGASGGQQNKSNTSPVPFTTLVGTVATVPSSSVSSTSVSSSKQQQQKPFPDHNQRPSSGVNTSSSSAASGTINSGVGGVPSSGPTTVVPPQMESKKVEAIPQRTISAAALAPVTTSSVGATDATKQQQHHQDVVIVPRPTTTATTTSNSIATNTNTIPPGGAPPQPNKTWASLFQTSSSSSPSSSAASMLSSTASMVPAAPVAAATSLGGPTSAVTVSAASSTGANGPTAAAPSTTTTGAGALSSSSSQQHHHTPASSGVTYAASANRGPPVTTTASSASPSSASTSSSADAGSSAGAKKPVAKVQPYERNHSQPVPAPSAPMSYSSAAASTPSSGTGSSANQMNITAGKGKGTQTAASKKTSTADANATAAGFGPVIGDVKDDFSLKFGDFLSGYSIDNSSISITPRGLINRSNYCYINTILQALVACPPFYHLMRTIRNLPAAKNSKHPKPFIDAMCSLVSEFSQLPIRSKTQRGEKGKKDDIPEIQVDTPFEPTVIYKMLNGIRSDIFQIEGRQEDAEEFLGCVLNRLNDEMIEFMKFNKTEQGNVNGEESSNGEVHGEEDADDWMVICGNRNKGTVTRTTDFGRSPISDIFRGKLRSRVQRDGVPPTYNIQPFFTLPLDIEKAASVKEALEQLVGRDELEGVTCSKTKQEVAAWQQVTLEELPVVLILHLKCFDYKMDGCTKILKTLDFPIELKIDSKLMSSKGKSYSAKQKQYKLFAVVYHDGKEASKGHYITDVYHSGYGSWIRYDDSIVKPVPEYNVLRPRAPRVPYLLYYRRMDTQSHGSNSEHHHRGGGGGDGIGGGGAGGGGAGGGGGRGGSSHSNASERNDRQNVQHHHHHHHHHGNDHHHGRGTSGGSYGGNGGYGSGGHGNSGGSHYGSGGGQGNSGHYNNSK
ncbi:protein bunched, class 2/F/G isoform [Anopheles maculipalpis]|uniref:protein bunched, class 2/F/G isoform n=1 Tax=Anopheles maculipalpis TaxID=1496333 RepID=UPI0021594757|nr:protein bunched, class 2/F/G isoform [Anopheles maculipalpis]